MGTDEVLLATYFVEIQIGFAVTALVTLLYGFISAWYRTREGQYIFAMLASLSLVLGNTTLRIWFGKDLPYTIIVGIVLFSFYIVAIIVMGTGIYRATVRRYLRDKREKKQVK